MQKVAKLRTYPMKPTTETAEKAGLSPHRISADTISTESFEQEDEILLGIAF
jgi:hypothetical protein